MITLLLRYAVVTIQYYLMYHLCFGQKVKRYVIPLIGGFVYMAVILCGQNYKESLAGVLMYAAAMIAFWAAQIQQGKIGLDRMLTLFFMLSCLEQIFLLIGRGVFRNLPFHITDQNMKLLISTILVFFIILIQLVIRNMNKEQIMKCEKAAKRCALPIVIFMAIAMLFTISGLDFVRSQINNARFNAAAAVCAGMSYGFIGFLGLFVIYFKKTNEKIEQSMEIEIRLKMMQKRHYEALLAREEKTKRYRHDMYNHLVCLDGFVKNKDMEKLQAYISEIRNQFDGIKTRQFYIGNDTADILTNYYLNLLNPSIRVEVLGRLCVKIDDAKLCTIYGNILQNAVEELLGNEGEGWLRIVFFEGKDYFRISVENSIAGMEKKRMDQAAKYHGIGLKNVEDIVGQLGGTLETKKIQDAFQATVIIPVSDRLQS